MENRRWQRAQPSPYINPTKRDRLKRLCPAPRTTTLSFATIPHTMVSTLLADVEPLVVADVLLVVAQGNQDDHHDAHVTSLRVLLGSILSPVSLALPA